MENEVNQNIPLVQTAPQTPTTPPIQTFLQRSKFLLLSFFLLAISAGLVFVGFLIGKNKTATQQEASLQPTNQGLSTPVTQSSAVPTAETLIGWQVYTSTTYNYLVKYPASWKVNSDDSELSTNFSEPESTEFISIEVQDNSASTDIHQWLVDTSILPTDVNTATHLQIEDLVIAGVNSVRVTTPVNGGQTSVYIPKDKKVFRIYNDIDPSSQRSQESFDKNLAIMSQMVASFKFVD